MSDTRVPAPGPAPNIERLVVEGDELVLPLSAEHVEVTRRKVVRSVVRVSTTTRTRDHLVEEPLAYERVDVQRVPVGRYVDAVPAIREEGDVTIMPVVEEVVVVERKLLLREEVHVRRVRTTEQHVETVRLREQDAVVTRTPAPERDALPTPPPHTQEID